MKAKTDKEAKAKGQPKKKTKATAKVPVNNTAVEMTEDLSDRSFRRKLKNDLNELYKQIKVPGLRKKTYNLYCESIQLIHGLLDNEDERYLEKLERESRIYLN